MGKKVQDQKLLADVSYLMGIGHDFGKSTSFFQDHLLKKVRSEKAFHGLLSSIFGYYLVKEYFKIKSMEEGPESESFRDKFPIYVWLAILRHHGDIQDLIGVDGELERLKDSEDILYEQIEDVRRHHLEELQLIYDHLSFVRIDVKDFLNKIEQTCDEIRVKGKNMVFDEDIENYFRILLLYSVLLDADKLSAANICYENIEARRMNWKLTGNIVDKYKEVRFKEKIDEMSEKRDKAYRDAVSKLNRCINERVFTIELPTGLGKTLIALSVALKLREYIKEKEGVTSRIIYALPFLSIVDQTAEVVAEALAEISGIAKWEELVELDDKRRRKLLESIDSSLLLKHHHLADVVYRTKDEELEENVEKSLLLIEGWHSEIIVTTFVQLFHSLITNRNKAARKFHNIVNSIIILDEVQSIPYEFWHLVKESLKYMVNHYDCRVVFVTATQPLIFLRSEVEPLIEKPETYFTSFDRVSYMLDLRERDLDDFKTELLREILGNNENVAVVVNTVEASKDLYSFLRKELCRRLGTPMVNEAGIAEFDDAILVNLSTHIVPLHRKERIEAIRGRIKKRKLIITTQLIEAGVDISVDFIYRDLAPLDCIVQTAGRCNRHNEKGDKGGKCKIIQLSKDGKKLWRIYDITLVDATRELLEGVSETFGESQIPLMMSKYFKIIKNRGSDDESMMNVNNMKKLSFKSIGEFKLIKEEPKIDLFIDLNEEAREIWERYLKIEDMKNGLERRRLFLRLRNRFLNYIISVFEEEIRGSLIKPGLGYIGANHDLNYNLETGFKAGNGGALII
jgi:CRISPR-associated endonuclease/helicase Cas3